MLKTANLTGSLSRKAGGLFESVRRLVQSLAQCNMDVRVFGIADEFSAEDLPAWEPVEVRVHPPKWPRSFGYAPQFFRDLESFSPDITHTHGTWLYSSVATNHYCRRTGSPYVISAHGMLDPWALRNSRYKKALAYFLYEGAHLRGAQCLRALNLAEARAIRRFGLSNPIAIIPNGIDLPDPELDANGAGERSPFHSTRAAGRKVLLYLGRLHPKKGLPALLEAWALARRQGGAAARDWTLAIAGWDQVGHEAELQRQAPALGLDWVGVPRRVHAVAPPPDGEASASLLFLGPQFGANKAACYRDCHAFILPSLSEGLPMVVLEAWAWRKPVLMTEECNLPEGFQHGAALRIGSDPESIARGLLDLASANAESLARMGASGQQLVIERFVWAKIAKQMSVLYHWVLGGGDRPDCVADF